MAALGSLVVKLALDYATYTQGLNKSEQDALKFAKSVQDGMDKAKRATSDFLGGIVTGALGAVASYQTVTAVLDGVKASIDRLDSISKASQRFGIAGDELQALAYAGELSDVSLDSLGTAVKKLSVNLFEAATGSKDQAQLFKAMGIEIKNTDGTVRGASDVLGDLADVFAKLPDGATKTALAVQVLGKSGADLIPLLNGGKKALQDAGDEAQRFGLITGDEARKGAEAFNDNLTRLGKISEGVFNSLAAQALPTLLATTNALVGTAGGFAAANREASALSANNAVQSFLESTLIGVATLGEALFAVGKTIRAVGGSFESVAADAQAAWTIATAGPAAIGEAITSGTGVVADAMAKRNKVAAEANQRYVDLWTYNGTAVSDAIRKSFSAEAKALASIQSDPRELARRGRPTGGGGTDNAQAEALRKLLEGMNKAGAGAGKLANELDDVAKAAEASDKAYQGYADKLAQLNTELDNTIEGNEKLSTAERILAELLDQSSDAARNLSAEAFDMAVADTEAAIAKERLVKALADEVKWLAESAAENEKFIEQTRQQTLAYGDELKSLQMRHAQLGLNAEQVAALEAAELREKATQSDAAALRNKEIDPRLAEQYRLQAQNLRAIANEKQALASDQTFLDAQKKEAEELQRLNDQIGEGFAASMIEGGKSWFEYMKSLLRAQVFAPLFKSMLAPLSGLLSGMLSGITGAISGGGGGGSALPGKGFDFGSIFNTLSNGLSDSISNAFARFSSSGFGAQLGLSTPTADLTGVLSNLPTDLASSLGKVLGAGGNAFAGYGISKAISGGYSVGGGNTLNAIGGAASLIPGIGPIAGAITGAINRLFGRKLADSGIEGTFGGEAGFEGSSTKFYKGGLFRSNKTTKEALDADFTDPLAASVVAVRAQIEQYAQALNIPVDALASYTQQIKFSTKDLSPEQIQAELEKALSAFSEGLAGTLADSVDPFKVAGESTVQTLQRLGESLQGVNPIIESLGFALFDISAAGAGAASELATLFGGLDNLAGAASSFYGNFYSEVEKTQQVVDGLSGTFAALGVEVPASRDAFRDLVEAQDLTTQSGRETFAALLAVSDAFASVTPSAEELAQAAADAAQQAQDAADQLALAQQEAADAAAEAAAQALEFARALREDVFQALDGVITDFLSGAELAQYRAQRIADQLNAAGFNVTPAEVLGVSREQIAEAFQAVGDEGKQAILQVYDQWKVLQEGIAQSDIDDFLAGIGVSADELTAAYNELNPAADSLIDTWRSTTSEIDALAAALAEIDGTQAVSALDALRATIDKRNGLQGVVSSNADQAFNLRIGQGGSQAVGLLKQREADLWRQFASSNNPEIAQAITETTLQRIQLEGDLQAQANQTQIDALNEQISAAEKLRDVAAGMGDFILSLKAGSLSNLSYTGRLGAQRTLLDKAISTGGDVQGQAQAYLQQAQSAYGGSSAQYASIFDDTVARLEALGLSAGVADGTISDAQQQLAALTSLNDTSNQQISALETLNETFGGTIGDLSLSIDSQTQILRDQLIALGLQKEALDAQIRQAGDAYTLLIGLLEEIRDGANSQNRTQELAAV